MRMVSRRSDQPVGSYDESKIDIPIWQFQQHRERLVPTASIIGPRQPRSSDLDSLDHRTSTASIIGPRQPRSFQNKSSRDVRAVVIDILIVIYVIGAENNNDAHTFEAIRSTHRKLWRIQNRHSDLAVSATSGAASTDSLDHRTSTASIIGPRLR
jgi:hypothetical protein